MIQTPGEGGLDIFGALRAPLQKKSLPMEIFISRHWFYLKSGTIDLLCMYTTINQDRRSMRLFT